MPDLDPFALAARQIELDRRATAELPALYDRKKARLGPSPHALLRGSAPLFYEVLRARPDLAAGPSTTGFIVGDMHLENVGAYRNEADEVVFALNDFDDAAIAPLVLDVLRLATSVLCAGREIGATGARSVASVGRMIGAYLAALGGGEAPRTPALVEALMRKVRERSKKDLLDQRCPADAHGKRRFLRGDRYVDLPAALGARLPALLSAYVAALGAHAPSKASAWVIEDAAQRIAGTGSLGVRRVALLVRDHAGDERLVELKECRFSSTDALGLATSSRFAHPAERVVGAARAMLRSPPRHLAAVSFDGVSFAGRRLFPQEDKVSLDGLRDGHAEGDLVLYVGHLLGAAHARGLAALGAPPAAAWQAAEVEAVIDHAVVLAGIMEGVYLAWVRRSS